MVTDTTWAASAQELLEREWDKRVRTVSKRAAPSKVDRDAHEHCPVTWVLPRVLELIAESHDKPALTLAKDIHRLIEEPNFIDVNGDSLPGPTPEEIDRQVEMIVGVVEEIRLAALREGTWSDAPVTPIMFG